MRNTFFVLMISLILFGCSSKPESGIATKPPIQNTKISSTPELGKCTDVRQPTPVAKDSSLFPETQPTDHVLGKKDAFVTILVYSDFQCESCATLAPLIKSLVQKYQPDIKLVFRNFPLISIHDKAALAAQAVEAAGKQGKFWEMHDFLFSKQDQWKNQNPTEFKKWIVNQSIALSIDPKILETDITNPEIVSMVQKAWVDGQTIKLPGTPIILINGEIVKWQPNLFNQLEVLVNLTRLQQKQFKTCPSLVINPSKKYTAILNTSKGAIRINLFADKAPNTVNNFVFLAKNGWFNNNQFHRVVKNLIVQTGDPSGTGFGVPGYLIPSETNSLLFDRAGMVAMANSGPDTNGSQFFITLSPAAKLGKDFPIFGEVTSGMEIISTFAPHEPGDKSVPEILLSVNIEEK